MAVMSRPRVRGGTATDTVTGTDTGGRREKYSKEVPQQGRIRRDAEGRGRTVTCGDGRWWTCCLLFASRGSGVRVPLAPLPVFRYLARSDAVNSGSPRIPSPGRRGGSGWLGGIWEIIFSLS